MVLGVGYCLSTTILASIYKRLNEISRSSNSSRGGGHFPTHFLYACLAKNFDTYEQAGEASFSPGMVKFSGLVQAISQRRDNLLVLGGVLAGIHPSSTDLRRLFWIKTSYRELTSLIFIRLSFISYRYENNLVMDPYCFDKFIRQFSFHQDVPIDLDLNNLLDSETMLLCHHMLTYYGTGSQILLPGRCNLLKRNTTHAFHEWWSKMFISSPCSPHASDCKRKRSDLFDTNISKDEGKLGSKPKLKIVRAGKRLDPFVLPMKNGSSHSRTRCCHPNNTHPYNPYSKHCSITIVCEPNTEQAIELPPEGAENIMNILNVEPNPTECIQCCELQGGIGTRNSVIRKLRLDGSKGVYSPNDDEAESICKANAPSLVPHPQRPLRAPQAGIFIYQH
ncbi:LOW QUALITY PROTEIN: hypothetical protein Cgig2_017684 [Carnegiea gigantea]|uniref:Uncharacterized protein n=1 Tax=Carnegiea gigantea TaxID=171969 RepID=A0A9Q1GKI2_9CARY|nr:LOW QUALITY PROTEIN: hypothetical protein Cgig2_017684 [Carnegiea gigantea]